MLLIAPKGIEILLSASPAFFSAAINRTKRNWNILMFFKLCVLRPINRTKRNWNKYEMFFRRDENGLLIAPKGIEISKDCISSSIPKTINRTKRNWNKIRAGNQFEYISINRTKRNWNTIDEC